MICSKNSIDILDIITTFLTTFFCASRKEILGFVFSTYHPIIEYCYLHTLNNVVDVHRVMCNWLTNVSIHVDEDQQY